MTKIDRPHPSAFLPRQGGLYRPRWSKSRRIRLGKRGRTRRDPGAATSTTGPIEHWARARRWPETYDRVKAARSG